MQAVPVSRGWTQQNHTQKRGAVRVEHGYASCHFEATELKLMLILYREVKVKAHRPG